MSTSCCTWSSTRRPVQIPAEDRPTSDQHKSKDKSMDKMYWTLFPVGAETVLKGGYVGITLTFNPYLFLKLLSNIS